MKTFASLLQKNLFEALEKSGELVFACGPRGVVANLVGHFRVRKDHHEADLLEVSDGTNHVHIDWSRVQRCEIGDFHGEGMLTFFDQQEVLFRLYRMEGPFSAEVTAFARNLL